MPQIFLLASATQGLLWPNPGDWNPVNKVECLGSGGAGRTAVSGGASGVGGGGGAYAIGNNLTPTFPVKYNCMQGGSATGTSSPGFFTAFGMGASTDGSDGLVRAKQGDGGVQGGAGGNVFFPAGFAGGNGGASLTGANMGGGGGGGAAGPMGAGGNGGAAVGAFAGGMGGTADGGTVAGSPGPGNPSQRWDQFHGPGGGGGGNSDAGANTGGYYGGAGGGGAAVSSPSSFRNGGTGRDGLIIITYTPLPPTPKGGFDLNMPMGGL